MTTDRQAINTLMGRLEETDTMPQPIDNPYSPEGSFIRQSQQPSNDPVNHPSHYTSGRIEVADFIIDQDLNFCTGNVIKYVARAGKKDPMKHLEDLKKAEWYLQKEIERLSDAATHY